MAEKLKEIVFEDGAPDTTFVTDGTVSVSIAAGAASDSLGNPSSAPTVIDNTVTFDAQGPTVTIEQAAAQLDPTSASPINFTVVFSESVADFITGDSVARRARPPGSSRAVAPPITWRSVI